MSTEININKNIYNSDGTLTTNRKVDLDNKTIDFNNGNVGINTPIPTQKLEVTGNTKLNGTLSINDSSATLNVVGNAFGQASLISPTGAIVLTPGLYGVQINGANPDLQVNGKTTTSQFQLTTTPTAGYVLTSDVSGNGTWSAAAGGLTYFTEAQNTSAPNATVPVDSLTAVSAATNADIALIPKGNGALLVNIPDNTTVGGNKRGTYAVDWQIIRNAAARVASGAYSAIIGGYWNTSSGTASIAGGFENQIAGDASVGLGASNTTTTSNCFVLGNGSTASGGFGAVALGRGNTASGDGTLTAGFSNTASGSRSISLGQQNTASGTNSTAIGQSNTAGGSNSTAIGYSNSNAGGQGCTALGWSNTITAGASYGAFAVGQQNTVSGQGFAVGVQNSIVNGWALGQTNTVSGGVAIGLTNTANGSNSIAIGRQSSSFGIKSRITFGAGQMGAVGDSQASKFILQNRTTDNTATTLIINYGDSITPFSTNQVILSNQSAYRFKGTIIGKQSGSTNTSAWDVDGLIVRGANAAATTLVVGNVNVVSNVPAWGTPALTADTTNGGLRVQVTGAAATNIQWTAVIDTTEVIYA